MERGFDYTDNMTAVEIIAEIKRLPRAEQNRVIDFVRKAGEGRPLAPAELGELANEMIEEKRPGKADHLKAEIVRGFYGGPARCLKFQKLDKNPPGQLYFQILERAC